MPRPPANDSPALLQLCPQCREALTFHNARTELNATGQSVRVEVYFCIHHGFFHVSDDGPLQPGM